MSEGGQDCIFFTLNTYSPKIKLVHPYYISPIEMRSLWQTITCIKSPSIPLNLTCVCWGGWDLSKEVLWVSVGQLASKLQAVNVRGLKKILPTGRFEPGSPAVRRSAEFFSNLEHWQLVILMPIDLQRPTVPLWKDLNLFNKHKLNSEEKKTFMHI